MRPIQRGASPYPSDFNNYDEAKPHLVARLGPYCSYCERLIPTMLAVEHVQPKTLPAYLHLIGRWDNFLLACVNCNSCKKQTDIALATVLLPDRDNTFAAFCYSADGSVIPAPHLNAATREMAEALLSATGLDKRIRETPDENGKQVALDRVSQRMEAWAEAEVSKADILANPGNAAVRRSVVRLAAAKGHFSIWMAVFATDIEMRNSLIDAFAGTRGSGCFDPTTTEPVSPAPNPDRLCHGGKI